MNSIAGGIIFTNHKCKIINKGNNEIKAVDCIKSYPEMLKFLLTGSL